MDDTKPTNKQHGEAASLSDASSSSTRATSSPGRARKVSMKIKKGFREVKEMLSPHHHHHQQQQVGHSPDRGHSDHRRRLLRRKSGPNESRRGPLAPVLDHLEKNNSVPIHLHISHTGDFSVSRKGSSSSYSCSDIAHDESKSLADIHQHIQDQPQPQPQSPPQTQIQIQIEPEPEPSQPEPESQPAMAVSEPPPQSSSQPSDDGERIPNPFLVDDPEDPLSDPGSPTPAPVPPLDPVTLPLEVPPPETVALTPAQTELPLPPDPEPMSPPVVDKPVPALPVSSETESETGDEPAVHLPQLVMPTMFLPIPNVRISSHLTWWLTRRTPIYY